jgi:DNA-binding response OmpR family regulator
MTIDPTMTDILVVEDEDAIRLWIRTTLEEAGYLVREAPDGESALRVYDERPADLVIMDLVLPNKGGIETSNEIRRRNSQAKIIAVSGSPYNLKVAKLLGADAILIKPFSEQALLELIETILAA